jgi:hypothetical protein
MKNAMVKQLFILFFFATYSALLSASTISFFLRPYPDWQDTAAKVVDSLSKPSKTARYYLEAITDETLAWGIFASYGGFIQSPDIDDQIVFPRKHSTPLVYIVVTPEITPIFMFEMTIHHWEFNRTKKIAFYKAVRRPITPHSKDLVWEITAEPLPENNRIPLESIILFTTPSYVHVPTGIIPTLNNPNLLLPDIYIKKGINVISNAFYVLTINNFFRPVSMSTKKEALRIQSIPLSD